MAMVLVESGGNPSALSSSNAQGLMQLTPIGVLEVNQQYGITTQPNLKDPYENLCYGILLLDYYFQRTGSIKGALIMYNGGYAQLARWRNKIPLTQETAEYLPKVLRNRDRLSRMFDRQLSPSGGIQAIVDDVFDDLYGTGESGQDFVLTGGLSSFRGSGERGQILCTLRL